MFISIGVCCNVKYNIDKFIGSQPTLFFDWLMTDMASVNKILGTDNIDNILFFENIIDHPKKKNVFNKNSRIIIKSLSFCESIHDVPIPYDSSHINNFIEKYKRRYDRIIEAILNNKSVIYFIRWGRITTDEKNMFIKNILNINPQCKFKLVELTSHNKKNEYFVSEQFFISINRDNYQIKDIDSNDWTTSYFNWKQIFSDISK